MSERLMAFGDEEQQSKREIARHRNIVSWAISF
jgi:hypothetical protein